MLYPHLGAANKFVNGERPSLPIESNRMTRHSK